MDNLLLRKQLVLHQERKVKPPRAANATWLTLCERVLGTLRRECLDFLIPLTEHHVRQLVIELVMYYNTGRSHMALGPGLPQPRTSRVAALQEDRHVLPDHLCVVPHPILHGLHHDYALKTRAA